MQKILILSTQRSPSAQSPQRFKKYALPHQKVVVRPFRDMFVAWSGQKLHLELANTSETLDQFDAVHLPGWRSDSQLALVVAQWLAKNNIPFIGQTILDIYPCTKLGEMSVLTKDKVPYPATFYTSKPRNITALYEWAHALYNLQFPVIVKNSGGTYGQENYLVRTMAELQALPLDDHKFYLMQEFVPNSCDYRLLVVGGKVELVLRRTRQDPTLHVNNTSQGAKAECLDLATFNPAMLHLALKAAKALRRSDLAGVDVVVNEITGELMVLEVNRTPNMSIGFSEEVDIAKKLRALFTHIDRLVQENPADV